MNIETINTCPLHRGKNELLAHMAGKRLTVRQMALAKCYECIGGYVDGAVDCELIACPLYPLMPYRDGEKYKIKRIAQSQWFKKGRSLPVATT